MVPGLITCPVCGKSGKGYSNSLSGIVSDRYPLRTVVHGGVLYDKDPYEWYFGPRPESAWRGMLAIREECYVT